MDFNTLTPENQAKYLALEKKMFSGKKPKLQSACHSLKIPFYDGFMWWSNMIQKHQSPVSEPKPYPKHAPEPVSEAAVCPTCGKLKNEVTDMEICRDVFHYL